MYCLYRWTGPSGSSFCLATAVKSDPCPPPHIPTPDPGLDSGIVPIEPRLGWGFNPNLLGLAHMGCAAVCPIDLPVGLDGWPAGGR